MGEEQEDRLLVVRESELREFAMNLSAATVTTLVTFYDFQVDGAGAEALGQSLGDFFQQQQGWIGDHVGHPQPGRPPIPVPVIEAFARVLFAKRMREVYSGAALERTTVEERWERSCDDFQRENWRSSARALLVELWGDLTNYFSANGVLWWSRLSPEDCQALLDYVDGDEGPQGEAIQSVLPKLAAAAAGRPTGKGVSSGYDSPLTPPDSSQEKG